MGASTPSISPCERNRVLFLHLHHPHVTRLWYRPLGHGLPLIPLPEDSSEVWCVRLRFCSDWGTRQASVRCLRDSASPERPSRRSQQLSKGGPANRQAWML